MTTPKERIIAALEHRTLDRIPICEQGIWPETIQRWETEGLPKGTDPVEYLELDKIYSFNFDCSFFPHEIYEDDGEYVTDLNGQGTTVKWPKNGGSSAGFIELDHKVKTIDDWRKARECLTVTEERFKTIPDFEDDKFVSLNPIDHFWVSFKMLGMENLCMWLAGEPDSMREMYSDYTDFLIGMLDLCVEKGFKFDALWFFSDMAYANGPMFSPDTYRQVIRPSYDRLRDWCSAHNKYMFLHTDGNLNVLMPELIDTGFDLLHPLEARADNDVRIFKEKYGNKITLMGNINADILARGDKQEIEEEVVSKISVAKAGGGYIYNIDHSVPPGVSYDSWTYAIELIKEHGKY